MESEKTQEKSKLKKYGMFAGVFLPTFLTIIGAILYLRLGFIVGGAGVLGAVIIILISASITLATGLSLSSIVTNIRVGAGGAYSIISKTLGLEVGGSAGIPLYFSQVFSVAFYIFAFSEGWNYIFPNHNIVIIALSVFALLFVLTFITTNLAIKTQYLVFGLMLVSFVSIFTGGGFWFTNPIQSPMFGDFGAHSFWFYFALFFPAVTGLMAGIGLSGELKNPKKQIPKGILLALGVTTLIYIAAAIWLGFRAGSSDLLADTNIMIKLSFFGPLVILGLLSATFSSALTTLIAAPRLLQAMSSHNIVPFHRLFSKKTEKGEPRNANLLTASIIIIIIIFGSLNIIAPLLTVFFLATYTILNLSVLIEQSLGLVSFRPSFKIPRIIPLYGAIGSIILIFLINVIAGLIAVAIISVIYLLLIRKKIVPREEDLKSGIFYSLSELISRKISKFQKSTKQIWKPNILIPITSTATFTKNILFLRDLVFPNGAINVLGMKLKKGTPSPEKTENQKKLKNNLQGIKKLTEKYNKEEIFVSYSEGKIKDYIDGATTSLSAVEGQLFPPNILFLPFKPTNLKNKEIIKILQAAKKLKVGVLFLDENKESNINVISDVNMWISEKALKHPFEVDKIFDLGVLSAYKLSKNWDGHLHLHMRVPKHKKLKAENYLKRLIFEGRLHSAISHIHTEHLIKAIKKLNNEGLHIFSFSIKNLNKIIKISKAIKDKSILFSYDSSKEDILA